jgi:hypothetical protein
MALHFAQINIARARYPLEDPHMACWYSRERVIHLEEAQQRLDHLISVGEIPFSFTLKTDYSEAEVLDDLEANPPLT